MNWGFFFLYFTLFPFYISKSFILCSGAYFYSVPFQVNLTSGFIKLLTKRNTTKNLQSWKSWGKFLVFDRLQQVFCVHKKSLCFFLAKKYKACHLTTIETFLCSFFFWTSQVFFLFEKLKMLHSFFGLELSTSNSSNFFFAWKRSISNLFFPCLVVTK